jgi:hypothetical protein
MTSRRLHCRRCNIRQCPLPQDHTVSSQTKQSPPLRTSIACVQSTMENKDPHSHHARRDYGKMQTQREASERTNLGSKTVLASSHTIVANTQTAPRCESCMFDLRRQTKHTIVFSRLRLLRHSPTSGDRFPRLRFGCVPGRSRNFVVRLQSRCRCD